MDKKYYTVKETAQILGLAEQTVRNYLNLGLIKSEKLLNSVAITKEELDRQLELRKDN